MAKLTEYPAAISFDSGDILIKDGTNGTKKISVDDASVNFIEIANQTVDSSLVPTIDDCVLITNDTDGVRKMLVSDIGGSGINYNVNERDTGLKWIDGKPIYQKTFNITPNSYADISALNIDTVVSSDGIMELPNSIFYHLNVYGDDKYKAFYETDVGNSRINTTVGSEWTAVNICITLRYTKTTDTV